MKGSDKWGEGRGPRLELVLGVLVAISVAGVGFYYLLTSAYTSTGQVGGLTVSTTGIPCNDAALPQDAQKAVRDSSFLSLSASRCYDYLGQAPSQGENKTLIFAYYNGTITYPCGTAPQQVPESEILVAMKSGSVLSARLATPTSQTQTPACDSSSSAVPLKIFSVDDVESTIPAVPQLNITLVAADRVSPITTLRAVVALDGGSQVFQFNTVSSSGPLTAGNSASATEIILSSVSFAGNKVYPITISGTYQNGQSFSYVLHFQIAHVP